MPPATLGTVCAPPPPVVMPKPHLKPASSVVGPISLLKEKVPPGGTTTPLSRCAASWMFHTFSGTEPAKDVLPLSIGSVMPSDAGRWTETWGVVALIGSSNACSPASSLALMPAAVAGSSSARPSWLGRSDLQVAAIPGEARVLRVLVDAARDVCTRSCIGASATCTNTGWPRLGRAERQQRGRSERPSWRTVSPFDVSGTAGRRKQSIS